VPYNVGGHISSHPKRCLLYFLALAVDFDGTIARDGRVDASTYDSLKRLKETGRRLVLVTGRELRNLGDSKLDLFDRVVAENGLWSTIQAPSAMTFSPIGLRLISSGL
jgi:hypothetical protein